MNKFFTVHSSTFKVQKISLLKLWPIASLALFVLLFATTTGCGVYSFADVSIPDSIKTVRVNFIENRAPYVNPQLSPQLTDHLKQKIVNQTRLTQTNSDNAHYDINGTVTDFSVSTSGISNSGTNNRQQASMNRLTVAVHITVRNTLNNQVQEYDVSRSFEFSAGLSFQAAQTQLLDEIVRNMTDDIFTRIFSNW